MQVRTMALLAGIGIMLAGAAQADQPCRQYTKEIRAGSGMANRTGTMCLQPDGTWKVMDAEVESHRKGHVIQAGPSGISGYGHSLDSQSRTRIYSTHPDAPTELVIQDNIPAYIVVDPYRWYDNRHKRDWSPEKRHFNQHHHGPGWEKHWKHHQKVLKKN